MKNEINSILISRNKKNGALYTGSNTFILAYGLAILFESINVFFIQTILLFKNALHSNVPRISECFKLRYLSCAFPQ